MKFILSILVLSSLPVLASSKGEAKVSSKRVLPGIQMIQMEENSKGWIHQFETLPLGSEMDHMEKMKNERPNQFASK